MKHKHAELIHAWADGARILERNPNGHDRNWHETTPKWLDDYEYEVYVEPKPDRLSFLTLFESDGRWSESPWSCYVRGSVESIELTWDGETGKLKSARVIK